jgi:integrase/recombinase XerD
MGFSAWISAMPNPDRRKIVTWSRARLEISGPLAPYEAGFTKWLGHKGYAPTVVRTHQRRVIHLSKWMQAAGIDIVEFGPATVDAFIAAQSAVGRFPGWKAGSWAALLEYLRSIGVPLADRPATVATAADVVLAQYAEYEATERGLAARSIMRNVNAIRPFVECRMRDCQHGLEQLTASEITAFVVEQSRRAPRALGHLVPALRSLLRYLHVTGVTPVGLANAVPTMARWKLAGLPKALPDDQVRALLASCDPETEVGQRDRAILTVLSRLGLRTGEVAALRLEDIDWRRGELIITGKGPRCERLPLPSDVGEAIVSYLTNWRPKTDARHVFVCVHAPHDPMFRNTVTNVVARAARRAGLGVVHAHRLRHSAATAMLGAGASLEEIGQVLRHRDALTTTLYAKVDVVSLRRIARPWPGSATGSKGAA